MDRCSAGDADYKFQVSCPCGRYKAKPKHRCPSAVLTQKHLDEMLGMLEQHKYSNDNCAVTRPIGDGDIWCYVHGQGCDWTHEIPPRRVSSRSRSPRSSRRRSPTPLSPRSSRRLHSPTPRSPRSEIRWPIKTVDDIKDWVTAPHRSLREISMLNVIAAEEIAKRISK